MLNEGWKHCVICSAKDYLLAGMWVQRWYMDPPCLVVALTAVCGSHVHIIFQVHALHN